MAGGQRNKNTPSTPTRQSQRLAEKTPADRSSSDESDANNNKTGPNVAKSSQHPSKKARVVNPVDMDIAFAETPSKPLNPSAPGFASTSAPKNDDTVNPENSVTAPRDSANNGSQSGDIPPTTPVQDNTASNGNNAAGNTTTPTLIDQQNKSQHDSSNKNKPDDDQSSTPMNTNENTLISNDVIKFQTSVPFNDIIQEKESKNNALNNIKFYLTSKYSNSFKSYTLIASVYETILIVSFKDRE